MPVIYRNLEEYKLLYKNDYLKANNNEGFVKWIHTMMESHNAYQMGLEVSRKLISQFDKNEIRKQLIELYTTLNTN